MPNQFDMHCPKCGSDDYIDADWNQMDLASGHGKMSSTVGLRRMAIVVVIEIAQAIGYIGYLGGDEEDFRSHKKG